MPSMILVTVTADGKAVQQIMQLGMSSVDLLSLTYSMKTKRLFLTAVSQQTSTILMVGIVTIDNQQLTLT